MVMRGQVHAPAALSPGDTTPQVRIQKEVGRLVEQKPLFFSAGIRTPCRPTRSPVAVFTAPSVRCFILRFPLQGMSMESYSEVTC